MLSCRMARVWTASPFTVLLIGEGVSSCGSVGSDFGSAGGRAGCGLATMSFHALASSSDLKMVQKAFQAVLNYWNRHDLLSGQAIAIEQGQQIEEGVARGIDDEGRLLMENADGVRLVHAGDVHLLWRND